MPFKISKVNGGYKVKNKNTSKVYSKKPQSKAKATAQLKALYANCDEARKYQKSKSLAEKLNAIGKKVIDEWGDNPSQISMRTALNSVVGWDEILRISHGNEGLAYLLHGTLKGIAQGLDPQSAFDTSVENENFHGDRSDIVSFRRRAAGILRDRFNIAVDNLQRPRGFSESVDINWEYWEDEVARHYNIDPSTVTQEMILDFIAMTDNYDADLAYEQERENRWEDEDYGPDPDFEYDRQREDEGLMDEGIDDIHDIRAEAFRIAEEAHKTGDESYVKELCHQAAARFRITMAEMYRMAEAMYNQHFASYT